MLLWTFLQSGERTIDVHRSVSSDRGRVWSAPQGTGIQGQVTVPLALTSSVVIAASNHRGSPQGIQLWVSRDEASTWDSEPPVQMWDARGSRLLGQPAVDIPLASDGGVWDELESFTFGTPDLLALQDGSVLMTYYATLMGVIHVRACRFWL